MRPVQKIQFAKEKQNTSFIYLGKLSKDSHQVCLTCCEEESLGKTNYKKSNMATSDNHSPKPSSIEFIQKPSENNCKNLVISGAPL